MSSMTLALLKSFIRKHIKSFPSIFLKSYDRFDIEFHVCEKIHVTETKASILHA